MKTRPFTLLVGIAALSPLLLVTAGAETSVARPSQEELDGWWADLYSDEPAAANAVIEFYRNPDAAVPYLKAKLRPLDLDPDRCRRLLKELGSDDEQVWRAAWQELDYLDPRLAIDLKTLMGEVTEAPARTRLTELCTDRKADTLAGKEVVLRPVGDGFNFFDGRGSWWAEHRVDRIGTSLWRPKRAWTRAARGVAVLERIGTPDAVEVLRQLSAGHADAAPTRAAADSLQRIEKSSDAEPAAAKDRPSL